MAPPSVLPDISPTRGEIGSFGAPLALATVAVREGGGDGQSPPKWGRCQVLAKRAGQRGGASLRHPPLSRGITDL
ncbi:MAG: hypothetical protein EOQ86_26460 [Mesorhizobium sp.]|nr:MAG: hypothetical protein EOQ85_27190 [Mesorhizobium sp.]RWH77934.1 MAG: hypothetical protein EOQ86_26460 [Mesorhizobium sp.]RWH86146.1 MAG: hypothetical protein EOQ87_29075 [Mesorhizobium sp.]RWH92867.1 MAG: hypothetical protein EOQ88_27780 [Mesorhizobium sp.]RWH97998.1 MAG: hypothetical protein EOQ89_24405 [Mesorhizobium sp.]